jgi:anti-anti-sigma factor
MSINPHYRLAGRVDATNAQQCEDDIAALLADVDQAFIIDLSALDYISSVGLRVFLKIAKTLKERNKKLVLAKPSEPILEILAMSGFDKIIEIQR